MAVNVFQEEEFMKKIFASMMAAAMVVSLAGCSNGNSSESGSSANSEGSSDNAAAYKLGMGVVTSTADRKSTRLNSSH